ncbi:hypothetical protein [Croceicoccus sediminis]|uniref:hypothetical protein n=1 Tax=Croceicoccus sediminis TaxID=2571150 RepID=UPI001184220D|nr:hypothetical protein [Croceicoccus sediminis]
MDRPENRSLVVGHVLFSHAIGLSVTGMFGTIGTTAGFSVGGAGLGLFLGGIISIPWIAALMAIILFYGRLIERHPFYFAILGPIIVCGTYAATFGAFLDAVVVSSVASSFCYLALARWHHGKSRMFD